MKPLKIVGTVICSGVLIALIVVCYLHTYNRPKVENAKQVAITKIPCKANKSKRIASVATEIVTSEEISDVTKDFEFILNGIAKISIPKNISSDTLTVYSRKAFPILVAPAKDGSDEYLHPIVTAGRFGKGKFAAYGHHSFLLSTNATNSDNEILLANVAKWEVASSTNKPHVIGMCVDNKDIEIFRKVFNNHGFNSTALRCSNNELGNVTYLKEYDVILLNGRTEICDNEVEALHQYVGSGGGIILGVDPSVVRHQNISEKSFWGNEILNSLGGVSFSDNSLLVTGPKLLTNATMDLNDVNSTHGYYAWENFKKFIDDVQRDSSDSEKYNWEDANHTKSILHARIRSAPKDSNFSNEITDKIAELLITKTDNGTVNTTVTFLKPFYPHDIWENIMKNSSHGESEFFQKEKTDAMTKDLKVFIINSDHVRYSHILSLMIDSCIKILRSKGETVVLDYADEEDNVPHV